MTARLTSIWRHPIKALSRESLDSVILQDGRGLPHDRHWAITHERSRLDGEGWAKKANFLRGVSGPSLMAVTAVLASDGQHVILQHPELGEITVAPDKSEDADRLVDWITPVWPKDLPRPTGIVALETGFTDVPEPWISVGNLSSHRAVGQRLGADLSIHRWRANLWIDGLAPWEEFDLVGREIRIGAATLKVHVPITRCKATMANPLTGRRDHDTLAALRSWDHQEFGVYAEVISGAEIAIGDQVIP